jgi:D-serine deaminase-like pyridoxal phosphate-dependent protein
MNPKIIKPTLFLNTQIIKNNIQRMSNKAASQKVGFRPHFKTHQSIAIGEWFREAGTSQITVSSLGMAEYFANNNWKDITVAFPANILEIELINQLASKIKLGLLVESENVIFFLTQHCVFPVNVWLKIDAGYHRTGLDWQDITRISNCASAIRASSNLNLMGLLTHGGNSYHTSKEEIPALFAEGISRLSHVRETLERQGFTNLLISVGDTPGSSLSNSFSGADEVRPGNFVYYDAQQLALEVCTFDQIGALVACPLVALHPQRNEAVIYGGAIHLSKDTVTHQGKTHFGFICSSDGNGWAKIIPDAYIKSLSQEHGVVVLPDEIFQSLTEGDLLYIVPSHSCLSANLLGSGKTTEAQIIDMYRYTSD